jgi:glycosyltransferase involved in cell wall biosynthesis
MKKITFLWDNYGPLHLDRIEACAQHFQGRREVLGIEICGKSDVYDWRTGDTGSFERKTLFQDQDLRSLKVWPLFKALVKATRGDGYTDYVFCHWNEPAVFLAACWLRFKGRRVFTMGCSKFDDKPRRAHTELLKSLMFLPYNGALGSGSRSTDYFRFLGIPKLKVAGEYNTVSLDRIRKQAGLGPFSEAREEEGPSFVDRDFLCVARLVEKKNLFNLLEAFALYQRAVELPRRLHICGSGPLEAKLKETAERLGIQKYVKFHGFLQTEDISKRMLSALALVLPSYEEQFGNVVPEAQAFGLPVLISNNAGARDFLVQSGKTGFVVEPDNITGMAYFMMCLSSNESDWKKMRRATFEIAPTGDVANFAKGIAHLVERKDDRTTESSA